MREMNLTFFFLLFSLWEVVWHGLNIFDWLVKPYWLSCGIWDQGGILCLQQVWKRIDLNPIPPHPWELAGHGKILLTIKSYCLCCDLCHGDMLC